jgi:hypothetical protein
MRDPDLYAALDRCDGSIARSEGSLALIREDIAETTQLLAAAEAVPVMSYDAAVRIVALRRALAAQKAAESEVIAAISRARDAREWAASYA